MKPSLFVYYYQYTYYVLVLAQYIIKCGVYGHNSVCNFFPIAVAYLLRFLYFNFGEIFLKIAINMAQNSLFWALFAILDFWALTKSLAPLLPL